MRPVEVIQGSGPIVLGFPHTGTWLPAGMQQRLNARGLALTDTDWHVDRLYAGLLPDVTMVRATFHRYVIDANRPPDGESLYPGQNTTGLVPLTDFDGAPIWEQEPDAAYIDAARAGFHMAYHAMLGAELARVRARNGVAILYDCHSIRSHIPFLFDGTLPDFNIGTVGDSSCDPRITALARETCEATGRTTVVNGRFKGGWTTRHYGQPRSGIHAIQMELAQSSHLTTETPPFAYDEGKAAVLRAELKTLLTKLAELAPHLKGL